MTIVFGYYQYLNLYFFLYSVIPIIISANFAIIISIFLFRANKFRKETIQSSNLLKIAGILIIIFSLLPFAIPSISGTWPTTRFENFILISYITFIGLLSSVPFFIAYGIFFYIFGKRNKREYNVFLMITGILWMVTYGLLIIGLNGGLIGIISILYGPTSSQYGIYSVISFVFGIIRLNGFILLIIHGVKNKDKNLMVVGILGLTTFIVNFVYYFVIIFISL